MPATKSRRPLSEEERAERREADRRLFADAVHSLAPSEGWERWLKVRRHFHSYSFANQLLIAFQMPHATHVAGFRRWLEIGYAVRRGERGIGIWAPCPPSKKRIEKWREEGGDPLTQPQTHFRMVKVFDRSQVDPLPEFPGGAAPLEPPSEPIGGDQLSHHLPKLKRLAGAIGYAFEITPVRGRAAGICDRKKKRICVQPIGAEFSGNEQVSVAIHELSHALISVNRRDDDPRLRRGEEEIVVESVAHSICSTLGLDTSSRSVPYVAGWGEAEDIERYGRLIDRLASRIEDAVLSEGHIETEPQPR